MDNNVRRKITFIFVLFLFVFLLVVGKLVWVNVVDGDEFRAVVEDLKQFERKIPAVRGIIYDAKGESLAITKEKYKITLNRDEALDKEIKAMVELVADPLGLTKSEIYDMLQVSTKKNVLLGYIRDKDVAEELRINASYRLWVDTEIERVYPNNQLAAAVIGYAVAGDTVSELIGKTGVEYAVNEHLTGEDGILRTETDRKNNELVYSDRVEYDAQDGKNIFLTIDSVIQYYTEEALKEVFEVENPVAAHAIVMDVNSGEILAMASYPTFDLNTKELIGYSEEYLESLDDDVYMDLHYSTWKNNLVQSNYELGSPVKLLTAALALENDFYTPDSVFDEGNVVDVSGSLIHCWYYPQSHGVETLTEAVENSCNPVFVKLGQTMGRDLLYEGLESFGLFERTNIGLPYEAISNYFEYDQIGPTELATMTFGHGGAYTPIQLATAVAAVVNGGNLMEPHIIKRIESADGDVILRTEPNLVRKVLTDITSQQMRDIMESVVDNGSGAGVKIPGLRIGGKTGTSEKWIGSEYSSERAMASFIAVAPIDDPEILIYVILDEPDNIFGSQSAAPVVKSILENVADYLDLPRVITGEEILVSVPNVEGLTYLEAKEILDVLNLYGRVQTNREYSDDSVIVSQYPKPGSERTEGSAILLEVRD